MRGKKLKSTGFTLIEIMLVLGISSLLMLILLTSYNGTRRRAEFTDAVERAVSAIEQAKTEASATVNANNVSPGASNTTIVFAKAVDYISVPNYIVQRTLLANRAESLVGVQLDEGREIQIDIPWGTRFMNVGEAGSNTTHDFLVFTRSVSDGNLNAFVFDLADKDQLTVQNYSTSNVAADTAKATFSLVSPAGLRADIIFDALTNEVTRKYLN